MGINMYLVQPHDPEDEASREKIASLVGNLNGFILMATSAGAILAAFDELYLAQIKACDAVAFASGVSLNPEAPGAMALQAKFAENIALQLAGRPNVQKSVSEPGAAQTGGYPPGFVPLSWRVPQTEGGSRP